MADISERRDNPTNPSFLVRFFATGFYSGYAPFAPGTAGSAVGLLIYWIPNFENPIILSACTAIMFAIGIVVSGKMERHFGDDPPIVVIDEVVGMWITLLLLPKSIILSVAGFILFRIFDIIKPPPARNLEALKNGWGIMLDDVMAGIYGNLVLQVLVKLAPQFFV